MPKSKNKPQTYYVVFDTLDPDRPCKEVAPSRFGGAKLFRAEDEAEQAIVNYCQETQTDAGRYKVRKVELTIQ